MIPNFYHSGEIGDIIYGLKAISRVPLSILYIENDICLNLDNKLYALPNKQINYRDFLFIKKLLDRQPYIHNAVYGIPQNIDYNLNKFRSQIFVKTNLNYADLFVDVCNFSTDVIDSYVPWLYCDIKKEYPITVIRVPRRTNPSFPWKTIVEKYKNDILFLGTQSEYYEFTELSGKLVAWKNCTDLLSICEIMNGAKLHIGNCTSITVCAEGLKKPMIFEYDNEPSGFRYQIHQFNRKNRFNVDLNMVNDDVIMEKINTFLEH